MNEQELLIFRYLDGECSAEEQQQVIERIDSDPDFAERLNQIKLSDELLMNDELMEPPVEFTNNVMQAIEVNQAFSLHDTLLPKLFLVLAVIITLLYSISKLSPFQIDLFLLEEFTQLNMVVYTLLLILFFSMIETILVRNFR